MIKRNSENFRLRKVAKEALQLYCTHFMKNGEYIAELEDHSRIWTKQNGELVLCAPIYDDVTIIEDSEDGKVKTNTLVIQKFTTDDITTVRGPLHPNEIVEINDNIYKWDIIKTNELYTKVYLGLKALVYPGTEEWDEFIYEVVNPLGQEFEAIISDYDNENRLSISAKYDRYKEIALSSRQQYIYGDERPEEELLEDYWDMNNGIFQADFPNEPPLLKPTTLNEAYDIFMAVMDELVEIFSDKIPKENTYGWVKYQQYSLPIGTMETLGGVKSSQTISIDSNGHAEVARWAPLQLSSIVGGFNGTTFEDQVKFNFSTYSGYYIKRGNGGGVVFERDSVSLIVNNILNSITIDNSGTIRATAPINHPDISVEELTAIVNYVTGVSSDLNAITQKTLTKRDLAKILKALN